MDRQTKVVISTLNSQYVHSSLAPWYLLAGIRAYGGNSLSAFVVEGTINEQTGTVAERIIECNPDAVCLCCYIWNIEKTLEAARRIKSALPGTQIVLGGPEVSYNAEQVLNDPTVDFVVSGEGERPLALLLNALQSGSDIAGIPGLCYRDSQDVHISTPHVSEEDPPSPYVPEYFEALVGRIAYIETSRGCPFSCAFCLSGRQAGVRYFNLERVKREIVLVANSETKTIKFVDRTFNANKERARELFSFIIENIGASIPKGVRFHFEIAGDLLDEKTLEILSKAPAGALQFEIGLQSFNEKTLQSICRKTDTKALKENIRKLIVLGIHLHIDLIAGLPYEDWDSFANSFNEAYALSPHMLQLGFLKLLHGSAMRGQPQEYPCEYSPKPPYEVMQTPWLSAVQLRSLHHTEDALGRLYNSSRFRRTLRYLLDNTGDTPFELFYRFGEHAHANAAQSLSLDGYTEFFYRYFVEHEGVNPGALRDHLVCDRLATNSSGFLPKALRVEDGLLRRVRAELDRNGLTKKPVGVRRSVAILYTKQSAVYVDYQDGDPVTGEYQLKEYTLEELGIRRKGDFSG